MLLRVNNARAWRHSRPILRTKAHQANGSHEIVRTANCTLATLMQEGNENVKPLSFDGKFIFVGVKI